LSVYPTGLTNYFESSVDAGATPTKLLDGPLALKSFACSVRTTNSNTGGFVLKLFDGSEDEIFRIFDAANPSGLVWGSFSNRFSFSLPLNGIRVTDSLQISIEATGTMTNLTAEGISVIYQR
tara:strand:- start:1632 stop:1997 length:366 start_codon:yes stop_codon:yes gene_type:complete